MSMETNLDRSKLKPASGMHHRIYNPCSSMAPSLPKPSLGHKQVKKRTLSPYDWLSSPEPVPSTSTKQDSELPYNYNKQAKNEDEKHSYRLNGIIHDELTCSICREVMSDPVVLSCSHAFCQSCINQWLKRRKTCPECRCKVTSRVLCHFLDRIIDKLVNTLNDNDLTESRLASIKRNIVVADGSGSDVTVSASGDEEGQGPYSDYSGSIPSDSGINHLESYGLEGSPYVHTDSYSAEDSYTGTSSQSDSDDSMLLES